MAKYKVIKSDDDTFPEGEVLEMSEGQAESFKGEIELIEESSPEPAVESATEEKLETENIAPETPESIPETTDDVPEPETTTNEDGATTDTTTPEVAVESVEDEKGWAGNHTV